MGQQQLLLVILVTIVVGIATIMAANVLNDRVTQANRDAVHQDLATAASYVQSIWERPLIMGGANGDFDEHMTEAEILQYLNVPSSEYQPGDEDASNENGRYFVSIKGSSELVITGEPSSGPPNLEVTAKKEANGQWTFEFSEAGDDDSDSDGEVIRRGTDSQRRGRL
ncbi:hypothetical protein [Rhodohalobacter sp.]|uniref:hypothetical protein n=1 Tax=Rhodohalobacter sp. TaxID=1974210 RepID=UPI002ACDD293|nr:hypothetical protein [Rhodohalobacter sp.]MDZ7755831.1 hypothetical protein [Rhodohalobacter sp.]